MARAAAGNLPDRAGCALNGADPGREEEAIAPAAIEFTAVVPEALPRRGPHPGIVAALALCVLLALGVIFVLPRFVVPNTTPAPTAVSPTAALPAAPASAPAAALTPAPDLAARRAAQDALARLQPLRAELEAAAVASWAAETFHAALQRIASGDTRYREQRYAEAQTIYEDAERQLVALRERIAPLLTERLATGAAALAAGDAGAATQAFQQVLAMRPEQPEARAGLARAATLPQVRELTARGQRLLDAGDLDAAAQAFQQALALDGADADARTGSEQVNGRRNAARHQAALADGKAALAAGQYAAASKAFERALALQPDSDAARAGLAQATERATAARLETLLTGARHAEAGEDWGTAASRYGDALALDAHHAAARAGQAQATARGRLDAALRATLATPQRLGDRNVQAAARALLDEARAVPTPGPRLREQIATLDHALTAAQIPIAVELRSDDHTQVTVLRVGTLGSFSSKRLELLPGDYVALGARPGYRDVRVPFSIRPGTAPAAVQIACTESI